MLRLFNGFRFQQQKHNWLVVSTRLKNISQIGHLPEIGVKIKKNETATQTTDSTTFFFKQRKVTLSGLVCLPHQMLQDASSKFEIAGLFNWLTWNEITIIRSVKAYVCQCIYIIYCVYIYIIHVYTLCWISPHSC